MTTTFQTLRRRIKDRAAYNRTVTEIKNLPLDIALDLDIDRADADRLARQAVYGR